MAVHHPFDTFATSLGTSLGVEALCENAGTLLRGPGNRQAAAVGEHSQCLLGVQSEIFHFGSSCKSLSLSAR